MIKHVRSLRTTDNKMEKLKESWISIKTSDSQKADLPCLMDPKYRVIKVFDYEGKELKYNAEARSVRFKDWYWYY